MSTTTTAPTVASSRQASAKDVAVAGIAAIAAGLVGNTLVAQLALAAGASEDFQPLTPGAYGFFTVVGVVAGLLGWVLVRRRARAADTLRWLVPTVLVLSLVPDVALGFSDRPGVSWGGVVALMVMHVVVTVAAVTSFRRFLPVD